MLSKNFSESEMSCKCGCGRHEMDEDFMSLIQNIRDDIGKPLRVSSAFRCSAHNQAVSSSGPNGPHTTGMASDFLVSGRDAHDFISLAMDHGASGVGLMQKGPHESRYIHIDILESDPEQRPRPWVWTY